MRKFAWAPLLAALACLLAAGEATAAPKKTYLIDENPKGPKTKVAMMLRGGEVRFGWVLDNTFTCKDFPTIGGNFIDFSAAKGRDGKFKDVDSDSFGKASFRDVTTGKVYGESKVAGKASSVTKRGNRRCVFKTRFRLEPVSEKRWRQYSAKLRRIDGGNNYPPTDR